ILTTMAEQGVAHMQAGSGDDDVSNLWLIGAVAGAGFYFWKYRKYRNTDKRHRFEHETATEVTELRASDDKFKQVQGVTNRNIQRANSDRPLVRFGQVTTITEEYHV